MGTKAVAIYLRVSTGTQDTRSQEPDLKRWAEAQDAPTVWFREKASGTTMDRPQWQKLEGQLRQGKIGAVCVWRLDRLGRTAAGLCTLFDDLRSRKIGLVSLKDGLDLSTPAGRLMAHVLASVAQYEVEVRSERIRAGQAVARSNGKKWGGSKRGKAKKVTRTQRAGIAKMYDDGETKADIARAFGLSRPTIYSVLRDAGRVDGLTRVRAK